MTEATRIGGYHSAHEALCDHRLIQSMYNECDVLMDRVLLTLHGEAHAHRRAIEWRLFRRDFARYHEREIYPATLAQTLAPYLASGRMDLPEFGFRVNINLSSDIAGIDRAEASESETSALVAYTRKFSEGATLFHSTRDKNAVRGQVTKALQEFKEQFFEPSKARRESLLRRIAAGKLAEESAPRDILSVLLANQDEQDLDDDMILREVAFFMQAGSHSSANALTHCFHEITQWCLTHPEDRARLATDDAFLQRCVHESLRLHPASAVAWRTAICSSARSRISWLSFSSLSRVWASRAARSERVSCSSRSFAASARWARSSTPPSKRSRARSRILASSYAGCRPLFVRR